MMGSGFCSSAMSSAITAQSEKLIVLLGVAAHSLFLREDLAS
jgi:hypothetical protein